MRRGAGVWRGEGVEPVREGRKKVEPSRTTLPVLRVMAVPEMVVVAPGVRVWPAMRRAEEGSWEIGALPMETGAGMYSRGEGVVGVGRV